MEKVTNKYGVSSANRWTNIGPQQMHLIILRAFVYFKLKQWGKYYIGQTGAITLHFIVL